MKRIKPIRILPVALLLAAGVFFTGNAASREDGRAVGFSADSVQAAAVCSADGGSVAAAAFSGETFRRGVSVGGTAVGGMTYAEAERALAERERELLLSRRLTVTAGGREYVFRYPEIGCESDVREKLAEALAFGARPSERKVLRNGGKDFPVTRRFYLKNAEEVFSGIADDVRVRPRDSEIVFSAERGAFSFTEPKNGRELDVGALRRAAEEALIDEDGRAEGEFFDTHPQVFQTDLEKFTRLRARFSTEYASSAENRKRNIARAAELLTGIRIERGEEFSFNAAVGARTEKRGFFPAKVILNGKYAEGVGGGVCQVSTTLYNAALLAGLAITEHHAHSLAVSYVEPSFDAMVNSATSDLRFGNVTDGPIFLRVTADGSRLTAEIYGTERDAVYERRSVVRREIPAAGREEIEDETGEIPFGEVRVLQSARNGIESEGYLAVIRNGVRTETRLRSDRYLPVKEIVAVGRSRSKSLDFPEVSGIMYLRNAEAEGLRAFRRCISPYDSTV